MLKKINNTSKRIRRKNIKDTCQDIVVRLEYGNFPLFLADKLEFQISIFKSLLLKYTLKDVGSNNHFKVFFHKNHSTYIPIITSLSQVCSISFDEKKDKIS